MLAVLETRRRMYWVLSLFFNREPPFELAEAFVSGKLAFPKVDPESYPDLAKGFNELEAFISEKKDAQKLHQELLSAYGKIFSEDAFSSDLCGESGWVPETMPGSALLEIDSTYTVAGYEPCDDKILLFKDHISVELDFMYYLCERSIEDRDNLLRYVEGQVAFLKEHLLRWIPDFCDELIRRPNFSYFKAVAKITKGYLILDLEIAEAILSGDIL